MDPTDSTEELQKAIRKLEEFSRHTEKSSLTRLQKTIDLFSSLILNTDHKMLLDAIEASEFVKRKRYLIQRLKAGNPAQQKLAENFEKAIDGFNASLEQHKQSERQSIVKFFLNKEKQEGYQNLSKIDLPHQATVHQHYPEHSHEWLSRKISSVPSTSMDNVHLSKQFTELIHMKVIFLLERYGIASNREARNFVKSSPIITSVEEDQSTCTLTQMITLFPGQTIVVKGSSELNPKTKTISKLFPETFCLLLQSTQTGFPHPSQRNGWTLANQLIPDFPQRTDLLTRLASFYQQKKQIAQELLPKGTWVGKAKKMVNLKREAFMQNKALMISLHKKLTAAIIEAAPPNLIQENTQELVDHFYCCLEQCHSPFDFISDTHQMIAEAFIAQPHAKLIDTFIQGHAAESPGNPFILTYEMAHKILTDAVSTSIDSISMKVLSPLEAKMNYVRCIGMIFGHSARAIMLQYFSEDLIFAPPALNEFERKLQLIAYSHVEDFLKELSSEWDENSQGLLDWASSNIKEQIECDINYWTHHEANHVADELADYFKRRYQYFSE